ncbi:hypothetical protein [Streptomyces formicae]|uniref:Mobile element protein n=1 Tax=Streptomyces formicae TaxID=1616117 RepID=A0ABY3WLF2_9ACTN|nr:hypothetical protein [Streptomyces formicae]UNM12294.1 hypothetical protein J4032_12815 [Streptomyces formicae]
MSYRHSSYRKMSAAVLKANEQGGATALASHEMDRVLHWSNQPALPKPKGWGKPKGRRS